MTIKSLPDSERPRERLFTHGAQTLSDTELLAILIGTGTRQENAVRLAERLLIHYGGLKGLAQASQTDLMRFTGLGTAKIAKVMAAIELGNRLLTYHPDERPTIRTARDAAQAVIHMSSLTQEQVRVILLDNTRKVIAIPTIYIGTVSAAVIRAAEVYREAVTRNAPAMILVHNHPSGDPHPSPEDIQLTHDLIAAGQTLDIALLDHLIIAGHDWRSLREMNLAFT